MRLEDDPCRSKAIGEGNLRQPIPKLNGGQRDDRFAIGTGQEGIPRFVYQDVGGCQFQPRNAAGIDQAG